ncbi:AraC family transcriptional regulator [Listeria riparia FSL S10-1204]|nr:AraC family transcriptional regulator [Listeria riparia FSL S10-1204]
MYISPTYISKVFKEETGESPINYLIKIRLSRAHDLLTSQDVTVKEAAKLVGYNDAFYFSKLFKKYYGFPPSDVLKQTS